MKKILDVIASFIFPRKMVRRANMKFFVAFLLILTACFFNVTTSNFHVKKDAEQALAIPDIYDEVSEDFKLTNFPLISTEETPAGGIELPSTGTGTTDPLKVTGMYLKADNEGVFHDVYTKEDKKLDITIVVCTKVYSKMGTMDEPVFPEFFDLEGYLKQDKKENTDYILYVFCMESFYFLYNLEQDKDGQSTKAISKAFIYEVDDKNDYQYYLPNSKEELKLNEYGMYDTRLWTRKCSVDDQVTFEVENKESIKPATRHLKNLSNALYGGVYSYATLNSVDFKVDTINSSVKEFLTGLKKAMIEIDASTLKTIYLILSFMITLAFPLLVSLIAWIFSRSFYLKKFKQYYAVSAICFFDTSVLALILGIFFTYESMAFPLLVFASLYFIVATFRINTIKEEDDPMNPNNKDFPKQKKTVEYVHYQSDASRIG